MADNSYKEVLDEAQLEVSQLTKKVIELDNAILKMASNLKTIDSKKLANSQATETIKAQDEALKKLNATIEKQNKQITKLTQKKKEINTLTGQEVANQRILKRNVDLQSQAVSKLAGAYGRLVSKQKIAKKSLQDNIIKFGELHPKTKQAQRDFDLLTSKVNKAKRATSNFSKTGLGAMVKGFRNLLGAFGIIGGLSLIRDLTRNIFKLSKQFDSFGFAMEKIITNSIELADTQEFLDRITQSYGVNLITTTERYIKFDAAARQSNLRMAETQKIFETVTKASGVLGLKTDELQGVYLALEQMLSKGKVTTEELRRQLGERLPGAFGIMANALDVSTVKLDKMLRAGEVLSKEALPKFAIELEKAFGLESVKTIDTLQAAQERLANSWAMFVRDIAGQDTIIQGIFKGVLNFMTKTLESIGDIGDEIKEAFKTDVEKSIEKNENAVIKLQKSAEKALNSIENAQDRLSTAIAKTFAIEDRLTDSIVKNEEAIIGADAAGEEWARKQAINIISQISNYEDYKKLINDLGLRQDIFTEREIAIAFARSKAAEKVIKETEGAIKSQKEIEDSIKKTNKKRKDEQVIIEGSIGWYEKLISELKKEQKFLVTTTKGYNDKEKQIEEYKKKIEELIAAEKEVNKITKNSEKAFEKNIKALRTLQEDTALGTAAWETYETLIMLMQKTLDGLTGKLAETKDGVKGLSEEMEGFFNEFSSEMLGNAGFDFVNDMFFQLEDGVSKFEKLSEAAKTSGDEFAFMFNTITEIGQEAFNFLQTSQNQYFDNQYSRLEQQRDIAIQFAGESTSAQEEIELQYEARRKQIAREQAKAQKKQAIFNIGIDTAQAIVATLAKTPPPAGLPFAALMAGIGLAQAAMVAATQVPEFKDGVRDFEGGLAILGDGGVSEIVRTPDGKISKTPNKDTLYNLPEGTDVFKNEQLFMNEFLGKLDIFPYNSMNNTISPVVEIKQGMTSDDLKREISGLKNVIKEKEGVTISIDKKGFKSYKGNTELLNNTLRLKRKIV